MITGKISFDGEAALQKWAIYILVAIPKESVPDSKILIYGGKVGDNRAGCNPVISRLGNHLSNNKIHSQLRNKAVHFSSIENYKIHMYYLHLEDYILEQHKSKLNMINESERHLILALKEAYVDRSECVVLNRFTGSSFTEVKRKQYLGYLTDKERRKIEEFVNQVVKS